MPSDATGSSRPNEQDLLHSTPNPSMARDELRALVREWTTSLKEQGLPPERVLAIVKSRVRDVILPYTKEYSDRDVSDARQDRLMTDSSQWCIEALFERADQ